MRLAFIIGLILASAGAPAAISNPEMPKLLAVSCGAPTYQYSVGEQAADGTYAGRVRQGAHCNISGRGARVRYYAACAVVVWDANGYLISDEILWSANSTSPLAMACL